MSGKNENSSKKLKKKKMLKKILEKLEDILRLKPSNENLPSNTERYDYKDLLNDIKKLLKDHLDNVENLLKNNIENTKRNNLDLSDKTPEIVNKFEDDTPKIFDDLQKFYYENKLNFNNCRIKNIVDFLDSIETFIQYFGNYRLLEENYEVLRSIAKSSDKRIDELSMQIYEYQLKYVLLPSTDNQRVEIIKPLVGEKYEKNKHDAGNQPSSVGEVAELLLPGFINPVTGEIKKAIIKIKN